MRLYSPLDPNISTASAIEHAAALARTHGIELVLTSPAGDVELPAPACLRGEQARQAWEAIVIQEREAIDKHRDDCLAELDRTGVVAGVAEQRARGARGLLEIVDRDPDSLTVLGARSGQPGLDSAIARFVRRSPTSTLVVRGPYRRPVQHALVGTDFSPSSRRALELTLELFPNARVTAVHVLKSWLPGENSWIALGELADLEQALETGARKLGTELIASLPESQRTRVAFELARSPSVGAELIARAAGFDLVALGNHGHGGGGLFGRTSEAVSRAVQCSVLVSSFDRGASP